MTGSRTLLRLEPGEKEADFVARIVATAPALPTDLITKLAALVPVGRDLTDETREAS